MIEDKEQTTPNEEQEVSVTEVETPVVEEVVPVAKVVKPKAAPKAKKVVAKSTKSDKSETAPSVVETKSEARGSRKVRVGRVVSNRMDKTAVVAVERLMRHPIYGKIIRRTEKFKAHDEANDCSIGDLVQIMETKPFSREKHWRIVRIVEKVK
ncbi:MAG: 30S ribosomal protein S17 [bacterium]|jgi:small subunit ribosomal protein S17